MGRAKEKPLFAEQTDYEDDFFQWCFEQADLLRKRRFDEVDLPNVIEELESMGNEQLHALRSSYRLLIAHLLKWRFQPEKRTASWQVTIGRERDNVADREADNPSLAVKAAAIVAYVYPRAVREAAAETGLPRSTFPVACPWSLDQLRDDDFLPE
ncbi:DUF29 domain-containing protein [Oharaeibacter diazotrophicus]|uniref:Uncharacterized protein DUF29 n=1 Tax=Oharaeibacter diazotrophicus TaxID=1920512 RepID=A0A4R6RBP6_9HYPH|nr:DUF29 domain-containing protein [Oharaeibacter diazotrophicus]TDP83489.1 uncharacterized protein DUF29 [Oharaeibacter diazotrophicus]BBE72322.1 hypothetical protein OHA_1_01912 [Pleomorphomonas sp. SM30]GLS79092.1 hypothetical protein GCM10007904_44290 [Oharaeibacter diazotrophicus]